MVTNKDLVEKYLKGIVEHDWESVSSCLTDEVVRVGPFGDTYRGKGPYVEFLAGLMPTLAGYSMRVDRVISYGATAVAELTEIVEIDGTPVVTPEALVFDIDPNGLIDHVEIYIQRRT